MSQTKYLVTGAMGCVGAWVVKNLLQEGFSTAVFDLSTNKHRLELIIDHTALSQVHFIRGDITDNGVVKQTVLDNDITHIIHLAALQVPFCKANPALGAAVNVVGTVNMFEAAKAAGIDQIVYASSLAVYGSKEEYSERLLAHTAALNPHTHYGVFKQANEGTARIYWQDDGIASLGLRPYTIYGPGRDQGMTSTATQAMLSAARGEPHHIAYGGYNGFQYVDDIAKMFVQASRLPLAGADVFNIKGSVAHMSEVVSAIETAEPAAIGQITYEAAPLALPDGTNDDALRGLLGEIPDTPLMDGVAQTISHFKAAIAVGRLPAKSQ